MRKFFFLKKRQITHWLCWRCRAVFTTDLPYARKRCECGRWMEHGTAEDVDYLRKVEFYG